MSVENLIDLPNGRYVRSVELVDSFGNEVVPGTSPEFEIEQTGEYKGRTANIGYVLGRRSTGWVNTSTLSDISSYLDSSQAVNTPVVIGTTYYLRSTSAQDGPSGTGVRSVRINYLDGLGNRTIVNVAMNGTTSVSLGNDISFVQYMESNEIGSASVAVGDITISNVTGAPTVAQTVEKIGSGDGRSLSGRVKVPTDYTLFLKGWMAHAINANMDIRLRGQAFTNDRSLSPGFHFQQSSYLSSGQNSNFLVDYLKFPSGAEIKISAIPGAAAAGNRCDVSFHFLLIKNT